MSLKQIWKRLYLVNIFFGIQRLMKWVEQSDNNSKLFHRVVDGKRKKFIRKKKRTKKKEWR